MDSTEAKNSIISRIKIAKMRLKDNLEYPREQEKIEYPEIEKNAKLSRFIEELTLLGVDSYVEPNAEAVQNRLKSLIRDKKILSWDPVFFPYNAGRILDGESVVLEDGSMENQEQAEIGLTGCDAALAETGSLVIIPRKGQPRTASLLPFEHVAVVAKTSIVYSMGEYFANQAEYIASVPYINIITGPSRTADIELTLTLGVHGPGKITVVIGP